MKVIVTKSYEESTRTVADIIIEQIQQDPTSKLGLATGGTAQQVYPHLVEAYEQKRVSYAKISTVNLDEYLGMDPTAPQSYRRCMNEWFFDKTDVNKEKTYVPSGVNPAEEEIVRFQHALYSDKGVDLQLLGVGVSGHVGFNEPNTALTAGVHIETLDESTVSANARFFDTPDDVPRESITMGMGDIMKAKRLVLIATGEEKVPAMRALLADDKVWTDCPVTLLKLHADCTVVIDSALADAVGYADMHGGK